MKPKNRIEHWLFKKIDKLNTKEELNEMSLSLDRDIEDYETQAEARKRAKEYIKIKTL